MRRRFPLASLSLLLSVSLLATGAVYAQQKQQLREVVAVGDTAVVESSLDLNLQVGGTAGELEIPPLKFASREREKYTQAVLAAGKEGATAIRRVYEISRGVETDPTGRQEVKTSSLQGKTVVVKRVGGKVVVTPAKGKLSAEDHKNLLSALDDSGLDFYPENEVTPGEEWTLNPQLAMGILPGADKATVKGRFEEVMPYAGRSCARIHMTVMVEGTNEEFGGTLTMNLTGDVYLALDIQRTIAMELSGPVTLKGESKQEGQVIALNGDGRMTVKERRQWLKLAGKPVPKAR